MWPREEIARTCKGPGAIHNPRLDGPSACRWNRSLLLWLAEGATHIGTVGQVRDLEYHADFRQQNGALRAMCGRVLPVVLTGKYLGPLSSFVYLVNRTFQKLCIFSCISLCPHDYTFLEPNTSSLDLLEFDTSLITLDSL